MHVESLGTQHYGVRELRENDLESKATSVNERGALNRLPPDRLLAAKSSAAALASSMVRAGRAAASAARASPTTSTLSRASMREGMSLNNSANLAAASAALRTVANCGATVSVGQDLILPSACLPFEDPQRVAEEAAAACVFKKEGSIDACTIHGATLPSQISSRSGSARLDMNGDVNQASETEDWGAKLEALMTSAGLQRGESCTAAFQLCEKSEGDVWDVVVENTFIVAVPRKPTLAHTVSAPGRIGACDDIICPCEAAAARRRRRRRGARSGSHRSNSRRATSRSDSKRPSGKNHGGLGAHKT